MPSIGASSSGSIWDSIDWITMEKHVRRLQMRIAKATRERRWGKVRSLQWLLTHSFSAKLLAVKRVVQNRGRRTAGVDGITWTTSKQKLGAVRSLKRRGYRPQPLRRIYIPKKNGKKRPLGIPTMGDRAFVCSPSNLWPKPPATGTPMASGHGVLLPMPLSSASIYYVEDTRPNGFSKGT